MTAMACLLVMMSQTLSVALLLPKSRESVSGAESVHHNPKCDRCSVTEGCTNPPAQGPSRPVVDSSGVCPCTPIMSMSG